jgi:uncharacterized protein YecE (DUF72 family)
MLRGNIGLGVFGLEAKILLCELGSANFLNHYASCLNTVAVNYAFRSIPPEKLLAGWVAGMPPDFEFAIKAHPTITNRMRLRDAAKLTMEFISSFKPLARSNKLGPILLQLPP